ncbi:hypothetical protein DSM03_101454 [Leeuwenhoekiella aestuarii]|uniref:DUF1735 domain-containing protein n=1 Tax=Leeuwenhoekiella aestuarii TaxID=2249426 RepID=A0A4Q0NTX7_9FLAO|nr:hypothetical protein [Leeuwenhoekiella aestuarii]RXG14336.1 hypothetical protein DSM04_104445 [Leeuwenhoekiella aestuarii]RXG19085.1 hypothetical protein DSM03_101454 [Leeuwenhoekiella aestuarii]
MKKFTTFFALTIFAFAFNSCDAVDELTEIDVDTTITKDLVISVAEGETTFSESASISIDDEQVQDNLDKIEDLQITKLTYQILSVSGTEDVIASGSFTAASSTYPWFSAGDSASVNLTTAAADGTVYEIEVNQTLVDAFEADLRSGATATLSASGTVSDAPVSFTVRITADVKVTVDAI